MLLPATTGSGVIVVTTLAGGPATISTRAGVGSIKPRAGRAHAISTVLTRRATTSAPTRMTESSDITRRSAFGIIVVMSFSRSVHVTTIVSPAATTAGVSVSSVTRTTGSG